MALSRLRLTEQTHLCNRQMSIAKSAHYSQIIAGNSGDHWSLGKAFNKILHCCPKMHLPDHSFIGALTNTFGSFSIYKVSIIRSSFSSGNCSGVLNPPDTRKVLHNLNCVTDDEERHLVLMAPYMPYTYKFVKRLYWHTNNTNNNHEPIALQRFLPFTLPVCPRLPSIKKPTLNKDNRKIAGQCPIHSFLLEVLETVVMNHLNSHIITSNKSRHYQSAYRKSHSTETAFLKIHNDILELMDAGKVTALMLLDLTAVSDAIDHTILLKRLDDWFGVTGKVLD